MKKTLVGNSRHTIHLYSMPLELTQAQRRVWNSWNRGSQAVRIRRRIVRSVSVWDTKVQKLLQTTLRRSNERDTWFGRKGTPER